MIKIDCKIPLEKILTIVCISVVLGWLFLHNLSSNKDFFIIPVYHWLNLIVAIYFAFFLVQKRNDERKLKDIVVDILDKIQMELNAEDAHTFNDYYNKNTALLKQRKINNKLALLDQLEDKLNIYKDVSFINDKFTEYRKMFGDHMESVERLQSHQIEFQRFVNDIDQKCDEIKVKIFK